MNVQSCIELFLSVITSITALISVIISVKTLKQNSCALEESTRPYIAVYGQSLFIGKQILHLVVKNTGNSQATVITFTCTPSLRDCFAVNNRDYLKDLEGMTIAPGQSITFDMIYEKVPDYVRFDLKYKSKSHPVPYEDTIEGNIKVSVSAPKYIPVEGEKSVAYISQSLHEIAKKKL